MGTLADRSPVPPGSKELITVLRAENGSCFYVLDARAILSSSPDPAVCGIIMADLVQHVTNALHGILASNGILAPREEIFERIIYVMMEELKKNESEAQRVKG